MTHPEDRSEDQPKDRRIIHIDMDAFFASVEQRDRPELRGKPIAVGSSKARGVVAAASYEARRFGVRSAMPSVKAARLCPDLIFVPARFDAYRAVSAQIRAIFARFTPVIEPLSLDEAYLDVTDSRGGTTATRIAQTIRSMIAAETGLTASAGVSYNKFLAKLASDYRKPNGIFVIAPGQGADFVAGLPVGRFHGIGPATARKMAELGLYTGADLRGCDLAFLCRHFGKSGVFYYNISRGIDLRPVKPDRERKSIGAETTFAHNLMTWAEVRDAFHPLIAKTWAASQRHNRFGQTITIKVRYSDFQTLTRAKTLSHPVGAEDEILPIALRLLAPLFPDPRGLRLLGVTLSNFAPCSPQPDLFQRGDG